MGVYCIQWLSSNTVFIYFVAQIDPALVIAAHSFQPGKQAGEGNALPQIMPRLWGQCQH